jgi:protein-S-isoprenylcysteine O-methyltransferase Ste14
MTVQTQYKATKRTFWAVAAFYLLIAFEFFYMASPFAIYFYSVYGPGLNFINTNPTLAWLSSFFLPHAVVQTASTLVNLHNILGGILAVGGFLGFCIGAAQVYYHKLARKGAVTGGVYNFIRHPQYASLIVCSFGMLLLWPRFAVVLVFTAMLFAYYFLAKSEEQECAEKFGPAYVTYKNKTGMFLPFRIPLVDKLPALPKSGLKRLLAIAGLYLLTMAAGLGLAMGLKTLTVSSLYAVYQPDAAYVATAQLDNATIEQITRIALSDVEIQARLASAGKDAKFINYIVPAEWYVSEIPMNQASDRGHYSPADYDRNRYKIIFTQVKLRTNPDSEGKDILLNASQRTPIVEVWVDLAQNTVTEIKNPPTVIKYENIPVPVY